MFLKGKFLMVRTPKTINGQIPKITNGQPEYVTTEAPLTARKHLEKKNDRLKRTGFAHLMAVITEVTDEPTPAPVAAAPAPKAPKAPAKQTTADIPQNAADIQL